MKLFYFCVCYQYFFLFNLTEVQKKKVPMPKIKKFRDLSRRQQNRHLLIQRKNENIFISREHTVIHNTQNSISIECLSKKYQYNRIIFQYIRYTDRYTRWADRYTTGKRLLFRICMILFWHTILYKEKK